ncbi:MAG: hypothetical protein II622_07695, partial [Thermoguttaceae bacterium]|nr:hypothetical protein [Thermoguttaceae bacterium]
PLPRQLGYSIRANRRPEFERQRVRNIPKTPAYKADWNFERDKTNKRTIGNSRVKVYPATFPSLDGLMQSPFQKKEFF